MSNDDSSAADRGSGLSDQLGLAPERATMRLTLADLGVLADTAERNGTMHAFPAVALQWAAGAQAEIERLQTQVRQADERADEAIRRKHAAEAESGRLHAAALGVIAHMDCRMPVRGWLKDTDKSREALAELVRVLEA